MAIGHDALGEQPDERNRNQRFKSGAVAAAVDLPILDGVQLPAAACDGNHAISGSDGEWAAPSCISDSGPASIQSIAVLTSCRSAGAPLRTSSSDSKAGRTGVPH